MKVKIIFFKVSGELIAYSRKAVIMQFKVSEQEDKVG